MKKVKIPFSVRRKSTIHSNSKEKTKYWGIEERIEARLQESTHFSETPFQEKIANFLGATSWTWIGIILFYSFAKKKIHFFPFHRWTGCCSKSYFQVKAQHKAKPAICITRAMLLLLPLQTTWTFIIDLLNNTNLFFLNY